MSTTTNSDDYARTSIETTRGDLQLSAGSSEAGLYVILTLRSGSVSAQIHLEPEHLRQLVIDAAVVTDWVDRR